MAGKGHPRHGEALKDESSQLGARVSSAGLPDKTPDMHREG